MKEEIPDCPFCGCSATAHTRRIDDGCSCGMKYCRYHDEEIVECDGCSAQAELKDWLKLKEKKNEESDTSY